MSLIEALQKDSKLRKAIVKAALLLGAVFFIIEIVSDYVRSHGFSPGPLFQGKAGISMLLLGGLAEFSKGMLCGCIGVCLG
jgi:hypothetical protein